MYAELTLGLAISFQHAVGRAITLKDDIHCASNAVFKQQLRCLKALFIFEVLLEYLLTGTRSEPRGRFKTSANGRHSNDAFLPTHAGSDQKSIFRRDVL